MPNCHVWDLSKARFATAANIRAKLKKGWSLCALDFSYGTFGGIAQCTHALAGPDSELMQVSDRTMEMFDPDFKAQDVLTVDTLVLALEVPFEKKDEVKAAGARWIPHAKRWCVHPSEEDKFLEWLPKEPVWVDTVEGGKKNAIPDQCRPHG